MYCQKERLQHPINTCGSGFLNAIRTSDLIYRLQKQNNILCRPKELNGIWSIAC